MRVFVVVQSIVFLSACRWTLKNTIPYTKLLCFDWDIEGRPKAGGMGRRPVGVSEVSGCQKYPQALSTRQSSGPQYPMGHNTPWVLLTPCQKCPVCVKMHHGYFSQGGPSSGKYTVTFSDQVLLTRQQRVGIILPAQIAAKQWSQSLW